MIARLLPLLLAAGLAAAAPAQEPLKVVVTIPDLASMVRQIGGSAVEVESMVDAGQDPHRVLARASMALKLHRADVLIEMGLSYEHAFLPAALQKCRNDAILPGAPGFMNVSGAIQPMQVPQSLNRGQGADLHPDGNPHFNLDPENGRLMARQVRDALVRADPGRAELYEKNWRAWDERAKKRIEDWAKLMEPCRGAKIVVYHQSWIYLATRYGLEIVGQVEPKPGLPPTAGHLKRLAETMRAEDCRVVLIEPWYNESVLAGLLRNTGAQMIKVPTTAGLTPETEDYLDFIDHLLRTLAAALCPKEGGP